MNWLALENKVAIVTGGSSGIGRECVKALVRQGARVFIADINERAGKQLEQSLSEGGETRATFINTDVTKRESLEALMRQISQHGCVCDVLVNNAGVNIPRLLVDPGGVMQLSDDLWDLMMNINLKAVYMCTQLVVKSMLQNQTSGVIINISSESGMEGSEGQSAYSATKAALYGLTRSWAKELGRHQVRVVGVAPGIMEDTGLRNQDYENALAYARGISVETLKQSYRKTASIPLGRSGRLEEVVDLVCYLASPRSSYIHGTVINLSGGKSRA